MDISYDLGKRKLTLEHRHLDFEDAGQVFKNKTLTILDDRFDYGEIRYQTYGKLRTDFVMIVWTERSGLRHVISMRKINAREKRKVQKELEGS